MIQLSRENLLQPETLQRLEAEVADVVEHFLPEEAIGLCDTLEELLKTQAELLRAQPEFFKRYQRVLTALQFLTLNMMSTEAAAGLFETRLIEGMRAGIELEPLLTSRFYTTLDTLWPDVASAFANALRKNTERLGTRSVGEYLRRYEERFGDEKQTTLQQSRFLTQEPLVAELSDEERKTLKTIVEAFDGLRPLPVPEAVVKRLESFEDMSEQDLEKLEEETTTAPLPPIPQTLPTKSSQQLIAESIGVSSEVLTGEGAPSLEPDPFMPHKPKPIPTFEGSTVSLRRPAPVIPPLRSGLQPTFPRNIGIIPPDARAKSPMPPSVAPPGAKEGKPPPPVAPPPPLRKEAPRPAAVPLATAAPPPNLPVASPRQHNQGQEITPYQPEPDPLMPHKPRPVPKLSGNVVDLKRETPTQFPISK